MWGARGGEGSSLSRMTDVVRIQLVAERKSFVSLPQEMVAKFLVDENVQLAAIEIMYETEDGASISAMLGWDGGASSTPGMIMEMPAELAACMKIQDGFEVLAYCLHAHRHLRHFFLTAGQDGAYIRGRPSLRT